MIFEMSTRMNKCFSTVQKLTIFKILQNFTTCKLFTSSWVQLS